MPEPVRIFVSHSHQDNDFGVRLVPDLRVALGGDESAVWYDVSGGLHGGDEWWRKIVAEITARPIFLLILSPDAMASGYVQTEFDLAFKQKHNPAGKKIIPILYKPCQPREDMTLFQMVSFLEPKPYELAFGELLKALGFSGAPAEPPRAQPAMPATPQHAAPPDRFPPRLAELGYRIAFLNGAEVILPPLCDVPAGPFLMGSDPNKDKDAAKDEQPQHWATLPAFHMANYPVTVAEYACFVRATNRTEPKSTYNQLTWAQQTSGRLDHPVVNVSWHDALAYAQWLAEHTNQPGRLPSEAVWEKAARWDARTGTARIYPWGDTFDAKRCNTSESKQGITTPAGSYPNGASPYSVQGMSGNVWEWTNSVYKPYPYIATEYCHGR